MDLYFSRRRFFCTSFFAPCTCCGADGTSALKEMYRVTTSKRPNSLLPDTTYIEYVGAEDEDKHYVVAKITWNWPEQESSFVEFGETMFKISDFLNAEPGLFCTKRHVTIGDESYVWQSGMFKPVMLVDSKGSTIAKFITNVRGVRPLSRALSVQVGQLQISADAASDAYVRDLAVASFFVHHACSYYVQRLITPWWREEEADFNGMRVHTEVDKAPHGMALV